MKTIHFCLVSYHGLFFPFSCVTLCGWFQEDEDYEEEEEEVEEEEEEEESDEDYSPGKKPNVTKKMPKQLRRKGMWTFTEGVCYSSTK